MKKKYELKNYNIRLLLLLIVITVIGILAIGSAKESVQIRQIQGFGLGFVLLMILTFLDYHLILKFSWLIYGLNLVILLLVQFFGESTNNSQRWIEILGIRFQPSELAKILLILFYAQFIMKNKEKLNSFSNLLKAVALIVPPLVLVYKQPDLSTTVIILIVFCLMMYVGGISYKVILGVLAVIIPAVVIFLFIVLQPDQTIIESYQQNRILAFLQPEKYKLTTAYQTQNSITAIGSGQLWGKGLNNNEVGSVKNGNYISEAQTDFIFAIIGEELGFVGGLAVILLETFIAFECFVIAARAPDDAGRIICAGVGGVVCFQSFINIGVATGIIPNTGIPLPFVSYGLTSLVSLYIGMGIVMNVSLQRGRSFNTKSKNYDIGV